MAQRRDESILLRPFGKRKYAAKLVRLQHARHQPRKQPMALTRKQLLSRYFGNEDLDSRSVIMSARLADEGSRVVPGDALASTSAYAAGSGTYILQGLVRASVLGSVTYSDNGAHLFSA